MDWIMAKGWIRRIVAEMLPDSGGGDGSAVIPAPTEADNGKVLVAQDGAVQWGYGLPVVEITSAPYPANGTVALSAEESAAFAVAAESELPAIVKFQLYSWTDTIPMSVLCNNFFGGGFTGAIAGIDVFLVFGPGEDGGWEMGTV